VPPGIMQIVIRLRDQFTLCKCPKPNFWYLPGKNDPHIGIPVGVSGSGWAKIGGEKCLDLIPFGGL